MGRYQINLIKNPEQESASFHFEVGRVLGDLEEDGSMKSHFPKGDIERLAAFDISTPLTSIIGIEPLGSSGFLEMSETTGVHASTQISSSVSQARIWLKSGSPASRAPEKMVRVLFKRKSEAGNLEEEATRPDWEWTKDDEASPQIVRIKAEDVDVDPGMTLILDIAEDELMNISVTEVDPQSGKVEFLPIEESSCPSFKYSGTGGEINDNEPQNPFQGSTLTLEAVLKEIRPQTQEPKSEEPIQARASENNNSSEGQGHKENEDSTKEESWPIPSSEGLQNLNLQGTASIGTETVKSSISQLGATRKTKFKLTIGNVLIISVEEEIGPMDRLENNLKVTPQGGEVSTESIINTTETGLNVPYYQAMLDQGILPSDLPYCPFIPETKALKEQRTLLLKKLITKRIQGMNVSAQGAQDITDTWHSSSIQHRSLSYRVPQIELQKIKVRKTPEGEYNVLVNGQNLTLSLTPEMGIQEKSDAYLLHMYRHAEAIRATMSGALCTVFEATFFLKLPSYSYDSSTPILTESWVEDWIDLIYLSAFQLRPDDPDCTRALINKEFKTVRSSADDTIKEVAKLKRNMKILKEKAMDLADKAQKRLKPVTSWSTELQKQRDKNLPRCSEEAFFEILESPTVLFKNFVHLSAGKSGLLLKKGSSQGPWIHFGNLNFSERRVLFLGFIDHLLSSFQSITTTLRRLQELYTDGYPMNCLARLKSLLSLTQGIKGTEKMLPEDTKVAIHLKLTEALEATNRFLNGVRDFSKIVGRFGERLKLVEFETPSMRTPPYLVLFQRREEVKRLIVPFATLNLEELALRTETIPYSPLLMALNSELQ